MTDMSDQPRKRVKLNDASPVPESGTPVAIEGRSIVNAVEDQSVQEQKFGITAFVNGAPGFSCIFKQRYTDFLVNEIDLSGKVLHLEIVHEQPTNGNSSPVHGGEEQNALPCTGQRNGATEEDLDATRAPEQEAGGSVDTGAPDLTEVEAIFGPELSASMLDLFNKIKSRPERKPRDHPSYISESIRDKQQRTAAHVAVRRAFGGLIETTTGDDNRLLIKAAPPKSRRDRGPPQRADGPRTKGKVGWDELGGEYLHFTLYKENKDTMEVLYFIASQLKVQVKNFTFAGTKDRRGATTQRVSVYRTMKDRLKSFNRRLRNATMCGFQHCPTGLQLGDLKGNEFTIALRSCAPLASSPEQDLAGIVRAAVDAFQKHGFINYYGLQRFGTYMTTTDDIGKRMLRGDLKAAVDGILEYSPNLIGSKDMSNKASQDDVLRAEAIDAWRKTSKTGNAVEKLPRKFQAENAIIRHLGHVDKRSGTQRQIEDWQGALSAIPRNLRLMYVHAYQSLVWNAAAAKRIELFGHKVVVGDLVLVDKHDPSNGAEDDEDVDESGEVIVRPAGEDAATAASDRFERARTLSQAEADSGKYSVFDIVLPQPGYDVEYPANEVGDFYKDFMSKDGLNPHDMRRRWRDISLSGSYRKVLARAENVSHELRRYYQEEEQLVLTDMDKLNGRNKLPISSDEQDGVPKTAVIIKMQLGSSQYATMALRELTKGGALAFKPDYSGR